MEADKLFRMEVLISDLIRLTARNQAKINTYEEQIQYIQKQVSTLEGCIILLLNKEKETNFTTHKDSTIEDLNSSKK